MEASKLEMPTKKLLPGIWREVGAAFSAKEICCKSHGTRIKPVVHIYATQRKHCAIKPADCMTADTGIHCY